MKKRTKRIPHSLYKKMVDMLPVACVDVIVIHKGKYLLVKRKNEPEKGKWWLPGGRILKGEKLIEAVERKIKEELGIKIKDLRPLGYYEGFFRQNEFGLKNGIHGLSIVFRARPAAMNVKLDSQSSGWKFSKSFPKKFKIKPFLNYNPL